MSSNNNLFNDQGQSFGKEEIEILHQILFQLFDVASFSQLKTEFWHWLTKTVTQKFQYNSGQKESYDLVGLYQKAVQIMESAFIVYSQNIIKRNVGPFEITDAMLVAHVEAKGGKKLIKVIDAILTVTQPEKIFFVNQYENSTSKLALKSSYQLLLIFSQYDRRLLSNYQGLILELCKEIAVVNVLVEEESTLYKALKQGHLFYSPICTKENLLFDTGETILPDTKLPRANEVILKAKAVFSRQFNRAEALAEGAHQFYLKNENELSCYLFHQAVAQYYHSISLAIMGKVEQTLNLFELRQYCAYITMNINAPFLTNSEGKEEWLLLLQRANEVALYDEAFEVTDVAIEELIKNVPTLQETVKVSFNDAVAVFERWIN